MFISQLKSGALGARTIDEGNLLNPIRLDGFIALSDPIAAARNFINSLERIPQTIEQYKEKNAALAKDIPLLKEIANKQWKKEDELKGLKSELAVLDRKIQLELAKDNEPQQQQAVSNGDDTIEVVPHKETVNKGMKL